MRPPLQKLLQVQKIPVPSAGLWQVGSPGGEWPKLTDAGRRRLPRRAWTATVKGNEDGGGGPEAAARRGQTALSVLEASSYPFRSW